ncbi:MAG: tripartite tricarboxylate transporter substrate binding protein [Pseudomonadota bacterium]|nr:tripartite tricarboxylate transporter substrate binding protein [Pseudomonadota bacterium]
MRNHFSSARRRHLLSAGVVGLASAFGLAPSGVLAQDAWPTKPIHYIVPFAAGGLADAVARAIGPALGERLGQPVVIDNRAGVSGVVGAQMVARAEPDGYTILGGTITTHAVVPFLNKSIGYDPVKDFEPVTMVGTVTNILVVNEKSKYKTLQDLIADLKAHPDTLTFGTAGPGTTQHLAGELLQSITHTKMRAIPYKGGSAAITDLMGGQIDMVFETSTVAKPLVLAGKVRALGTTGPEPVAGLPGVKPLAQEGVPGFDVRSWQGIFVPAKTPAAVVKRLAAELDAVLKMPEVRQRMALLGVDVSGLGPEAFGQYQRAEIARWGKVIKDAGITAQ